MLVIKVSKKVAAIYPVAFLRLYAHYAFTEILTIKPYNANGRSHLISDAGWVNDYDRNRSRYMR
jgi:hypothetical protein